MRAFSRGAAGVLLVIGILCLGRALETALDNSPNRLGKRETITAGVLLGGPMTAGGGWLLVHDHRQQRLAEQQRLQEIFFKLVKAGRGKVAPLRFAIEANLDGVKANAYLSDRAREFDATFQVDVEGGLIYCFTLGEVDSRLLRPGAPLSFDVILEAVPPAKQRDIIRTVQKLTGLDWKAVKALVRDLPQPIQTGASQQTAEEFKRELEAVGAQVAVVLQSDSPAG